MGGSGRAQTSSDARSSRGSSPMARYTILLVALLNMSDHGDKCKEAVISSGCGVFCLAYVQSYQDGTMASGLNFNEQEKGLLLVTVDLAKEISKLCE